MSRLQEYNPEFGVVFDEIDDAIAAALGSGASGGGGTPPKPDANANRPAGTEVSPGRIVSPNGLTTYMFQNGTWTASPYPPSAADKAAAGIGGASGSTTPRIDYTAQKSQTQQQQGGSATLPPGAYQVAATRAVDRSGLTVWTKDPATGNWTNAGFPPNTADKQAAMRIAAAERQGGTTQPTTTTTGTTPTTPSTPTPVANPLGGNQAPLLSGFKDFTTPGQQISGDERRTMYTGNEMNTLSTRALNPGGPTFGVTGIKPLGSGNNYNFTPQSTLPAYAQFPNTAFSVPKDYVAGPSGYNDRGFFTPVDIPFGITNPSLTSQGGAGVATLQGPQNLTMSNADKSVGYGMTVNSPFAYNNIGTTMGRELGGINKDAATGAVESLMLANAQQLYGPAGAMAILQMSDPGARTGQPGLYGNLRMEGSGSRPEDMWDQLFGLDGSGGYAPADVPFGSMATGGRVMPMRHMMPNGEMMRGPMMMAGGGRVASGPLGVPGSTNGPKTMVTDGPILGISLDAFRQGRIEPKLLVGEDNADRDLRPDPERLTWRNGMMNVKPLDPVRMMAGGGNVRYQQQEQDPRITNPPLPWYRGQEVFPGWQTTTLPQQYFMPSFLANQNGLTGLVRFAEGGNIIGDDGNPPTGSDLPPVTPPDTNPPPTNQPPPSNQPPPVQPYDFPPMVDPYKGFNPLDPTLNAPWQQAMNTLNTQDAARRTYGYRDKFAGLSGPTGLTVLPGQTPSAELPPNMFYDYRPQVEKIIGDLTNAQSSYRNLGPEEDVSGDLQVVAQIGSALEDIKRIGDLELQRQVVFAGVPADTEIADWQSKYADLQNERARLISVGQQESPQMQTVLEQMKYFENLLGSAQSKKQEAQSKAATYDAQIAGLRARLGNVNEADLRTELARRQERINTQDKRVQFKAQVANLAKVGVPKLNGPILPIKAAA